RMDRHRWPAPAGTAEHGNSDAADLVHRATGMRGAGLAAAPSVAARRPDHCRPVARRPGVARCGGPRSDGRRRLADRVAGCGYRCGGVTDSDVNIPSVLREVEAAYARYEDALVNNR